jgi:hypothetical protein
LIKYADHTGTKQIELTKKIDSALFYPKFVLTMEENMKLLKLLKISPAATKRLAGLSASHELYITRRTAAIALCKSNIPPSVKGEIPYCYSLE